MNKKVAEIVAGMIPHKMTRNRWRGILRYGVFRAIGLKRRLKHDHTQPEHYLTVCAIAKNEGPYFVEWIEWHRRQGVDKFYIYDNESTDGTREILEPFVRSGLVEYRYWPGYRKQLAAYDDCLERHRLSARWIAFIDLDEFIVPIEDRSIPEFLRRFEEVPAVEINWLIYGSGGAKIKTAGTMMERFKRHSVPNHCLNRHVKSIVDPRRVFAMIGCHEAARISGHAADSHGNPIKRNFRDREPQQDVIRINHYAVRSYEEFLEKQARGRASGRQKTVKSEYFDQYDLNDIEERQQIEVEHQKRKSTKMMEDIDLVYLWVDGSDPKWVEKRNTCIGKPVEGSGTNCKGRYADNDELKYSLRSVELYAPWIRKIFIVTDEQTPRWIDTSNPKIRIVDHKEILPAESLPCFNANVLEHHLHKIPGLAERFLFANDDMFFNRLVTPSDFFAADGLPIARMNRRPFRKLTLFIKGKMLGKAMSNYLQIIQNAALAVERKYGTYYGDKAHHNIDAYLKSEYAHVRAVFDAEIEPTLSNHVRSSNDIQRNLYTYAGLAEKRMHLRYVGQRTSFRFHIEKKRHYNKLARYNPLLFCMNDSEYATDADRKRVTAFLSERFAEKSSFEK